VRWGRGGNLTLVLRRRGAKGAAAFELGGEKKNEHSPSDKPMKKGGLGELRNVHGGPIRIATPRKKGVEYGAPANREKVAK